MSILYKMYEYNLDYIQKTKTKLQPENRRQETLKQVLKVSLGKQTSHVQHSF